jgi:predicted PurR-regulated permease PerM
MEAFAGLYALIFLFGIVLAVCWIIVPFAIIGTKPLLRSLLDEQRRTNQLLTRVAQHLAPAPPPPRESAAGPQRSATAQVFDELKSKFTGRQG